MKDHENMNDFEINKEVFFKAGVDYQDCIATNSKGSSVHYGDGANWHEFNPCNNPSDAWPIILVNRINVYASEGPDFMPWMAGCDGFMVSNKNPLRAAMIVFLMMQESKS